MGALESHALSTGLFESVNGHAPRNSPGAGVTCSIWPDYIGPATAVSGLNSTSALLRFVVTIYTNGAAQPYDGIETSVMGAVDGLLTAYSGAFTLGGLVKEVDLLGEHGTPLAAQAGWVTFADGQQFRVMAVTATLVVNDAWNQVP